MHVAWAQQRAEPIVLKNTAVTFYVGYVRTWNLPAFVTYFTPLNGLYFWNNKINNKVGSTKLTILEGSEYIQ